MVLVPLAPWTSVKVLGEAESVKLGVGTGLIVRETVVELPKLPDVPVMVTVDVPGAAVLLAVNVMVLVPVVLEGLKEAVTPVGRPEAAKLTLPANPFCGITVIVLVPLVPCISVTLLGLDERPKPGIAVEPGQLLTKLKALTVPMPVAKSQPVVVPYAG